jgi:2-polyprenyl-3-methyl-5-hydroxy-6-metoxy-1,4-benzoquinol methylase
VDGNYLKHVRDQYEDYPYPYRNPQDEKKRLINTALDGLPYLNHHALGGRESFRGGYQVLVAGGGTGDSLIYLAEQLRSIPNARVTYVDISSASMAIARERAAVRGLTNIDWHQLSLLDVAKLGQAFDYINCSGVLHHLASPEDGLAALASVLKPDGAMGIMVYAQYGRTAVYQMQDLMRLINEPDTPAAEKVARTKSVLAQLPPNNLFRQQAQQWNPEFQRNGDVGIYDLLLHATDRAYTVPQIHDWLRGAGLTCGRFSGFLGWSLLYRPEFVFGRDPEVMAHINAHDLPTRQAIAELAHGNLSRHIFYAVKTVRPAPDLTDPDMIPFFYMQYFHGPDLAAQVRPNQPLVLQPPATTLRITVPYSAYLADSLRLLDGQNTIGDILDGLCALYTAATRTDVQHKLATTLSQLEEADVLLCRHRSVPAFTAERDLQQRMAS